MRSPSRNTHIMKHWAGPAIVAVVSLAVAGCANRPTIEPFTVIVRGPASSCTNEVNGRLLTTDELLATARTEMKPGRSAIIAANVDETPYRCFGGTIYTLQMAGFTNVGFIAEPAAKDP